MGPKVDAIIPVHNCERFIGEAIDSILKQSYQNLQVIVVNDGSTDQTKMVVEKKIIEDNRVSLINSKKKGLTSVLNIGFKNSTAPYIGFLDADDLWEPTKLEKQLSYLVNQEHELACFTMIQEFESFQDPTLPQKYRARKEVMNGMVRGTLLAKRQLLDILGDYNPETTMGEFMEWLSPLLSKGIKFYTLPETLTLRRIHDNNMTRGVSAEEYLNMIKTHLLLKRNA